MDLVIDLKEITREFVVGQQKVRALRGINIEVQRNEYAALMGPSGSGKSTLMNVIGCLDTPTAGSYLLNQKDVSKMVDNELAEIRNTEIGFVFQTFNLLPRYSSLDNVALPLVYAGWSKKDRLERAAEVLEMVGLGDRMDHNPNELSGGQRQRVAVARALVNNPSIILADEPTGNLDPQLSAEIMDLFRQFCEVGVTVLIATHDVDLISRMGIRRLQLQQGKLVEDGVPDHAA